MSILQIQNLTFCYPGSYDDVFTAASVQLDTDWKLGLTGRNGRGKTTLLRLLQGHYPYGGRILHADGLQMRYFPYPVADPCAAVSDIAATALPNTKEWQIVRELSRLGLPPDTVARRFDTLSHGERTKVLLALLFLQPDAYPLIDEPTNHLDAQGRAQVGDYLRAQSGGFLLVSHDRALLDACCDHMLAIERTGLRVQQGNFSDWWRETQARDARETAENQRLNDEIDRLRDAARRSANWSQKGERAKFDTKNSGLRPDRGYVGHKAAKMMKRAKVTEQRRETAIQQKSTLLQNLEYAEDLKLTPLTHPKPCLLHAENLSIQYAARPVCGNVNFTLKNGDRLALTGKNGSGKTSLLRLITGQAVPHTGTLTLASGLRLSVVAQSSDGLPGGTAADYAVQCGVEVSRFLAIARKFGLERVHFEKDICELSEGQRKKLMLARSLCESAHLYLWDEPLNYIDLYARMQIQKLLLQYRPTMLFVEHDAAFCAAVCTGQVALG